MSLSRSQKPYQSRALRREPSCDRVVRRDEWDPHGLPRSTSMLRGGDELCRAARLHRRPHDLPAGISYSSWSRQANTTRSKGTDETRSTIHQMCQIMASHHCGKKAQTNRSANCVALNKRSCPLRHTSFVRRILIGVLASDISIRELNTGGGRRPFGVPDRRCVAKHSRSLI